MLRVGFCGSGRFAELCLRQLAAGCEIAWVITNSPKASGRGLQLHKTPVNETAEELGISCYTTDRLSADTKRIEWLKKNCADLIFVIDFGQMIKEPVLSLPKYGCINLHPSKLPAYRGSAPLQRCIMDGLRLTAVSIFRLDEGMDSGSLLAQPKVEIADSETYETLLEKCAVTGCKEMLRLLEAGAENWNFVPQPQKGVSLAPKIEKSEGKINWARSAFECSCLIRALANAPGVFCFYGGKRLRLFKAEIVNIGKNAEAGTIIAVKKGYPVIACGQNALKLEIVQPDGKRQQSAADWLRGARLSLCGKLE